MAVSGVEVAAGQGEEKEVGEWEVAGELGGWREAEGESEGAGAWEVVCVGVLVLLLLGAALGETAGVAVEGVVLENSESLG